MAGTQAKWSGWQEEEDDDVPALSPDTLLALTEFLTERSKQQTSAEAQDSVEEDWQLSQFWYTDETSQTLAEEALEQAGPRGRIACLSTPSAFKALKRVVTTDTEVVLFEYDRRFGRAYPDQFVFFDYNNPLTFGNSSAIDSEKYRAFFDVVLIDPPFLSEECMAQYVKSVRFISKPTTRLLIMTGRVMEELLLMQKPEDVGGTMRVCQWQPKHSNKLSNEFCCYTNYDSPRLNPGTLAPDA